MKSTFYVLFSILVFASITSASEPRYWSVSSKADVLKGDSRGVSIGPNGTISLAPRLTEVFKTEQQFVWSSVADASGNVYLGTGGEGKVYKVDPSGKGTLYADLDELNVAALAFGRNGELFAGTAPDGKVYRIDATGRAEPYFSPGEKYIWSLAVLSDGSLAVATGDAGKIYKVRSANATPESSLLFDTSETHVISLAADRQGNLYVGTDSNGIVMRFGADGKPFGVLDSPLREIHEIAVAPDGSLYVLALGESASAPKADAAAAPTATPENKTVSVEAPNPAAVETPAKSRYDLTGAKSAVYHIRNDGASDLIWASTTVTGFSLYAHQTGRGVLVGTSDKGRIFNVTNAGDETLVLQTDASQISTIVTDGRSLIATSSNQGSMFRFGPDTFAEGNYESAVLDAKANAAWGRIWWRSSGNVSIQTRSGNTENPDETWNAWSTPLTEQAGGQSASPRARYFQWRAVLRGANATLSEVTLAYIARNIAPEVLSISVLPTNVGLAPNPAVQIDPNIELAGMSPADFGIPVVSVAPRKVFQRGATSLQWNAEDRNGDKLTFDVMYREVSEANFKPLRTGLTDNFLTIDGQSLADGRYVFRIVASDQLSNPLSIAMTGDRSTDPIDIDNTPPVVTLGATNGSRVTFTATDSASYIIRAEYSVNGGEWKAVFPDDGIADSRTETFTIDVGNAAGEQVVTIRAFDVNRNSGNARQIVRR